MPRIFVDQILRLEEVCVLPQAAAHHLTRVLRLRAGDPVTLFNGRGGEFHGQLITGPGRETRVRLTADAPGDRESPLLTILAQGLARGERMDYTLQKAVELGVTHIVPLLTRRCNVQLDDARSARRMDHWRGVIIHACEQSGRTRLPSLAPLQSLPEFAAAMRTDCAYVLDPAGDASLTPSTATGATHCLVVGPEGGLDASELELLSGHGFKRVRLGPRVLRTETAAMVALSILQARGGDL